MDEKTDEKEVQKREEKREEKRHRDPVSSVVWACILIWAGVVLLAGNLGLLDRFTDLLETLSLASYDLPWEIPFIQLAGWRLFFLGAGAIVLVELLVRLVMPAYRRGMIGTIIGAIVLFGIGIGRWELIWPLILIAVGVGLALGGLVRRR